MNVAILNFFKLFFIMYNKKDIWDKTSTSYNQNFMQGVKKVNKKENFKTKTAILRDFMDYKGDKWQYLIDHPEARAAISTSGSGPIVSNLATMALATYNPGNDYIPGGTANLPNIYFTATTNITGTTNTCLPFWSLSSPISFPFQFGFRPLYFNNLNGFALVFESGILISSNYTVNPKGTPSPYGVQSTGRPIITNVSTYNGFTIIFRNDGNIEFQGAAGVAFNAGTLGPFVGTFNPSSNAPVYIRIQKTLIQVSTNGNTWGLSYNANFGASFNYASYYMAAVLGLYSGINFSSGNNIAQIIPVTAALNMA